MGFFIRNRKFRAFFPASVVAYALVCFTVVTFCFIVLLARGEAHKIDGSYLLVLTAVVVLIQSAALTKALSDHFDRHRVNHLRYYGLSARDISVLGCLFLLVPNSIVGTFVFLVASILGSGLPAFLLGGFTFLLCEALPPLLTNRGNRSEQKKYAQHLSKRGSKRMCGQSFASKPIAYLFRDLKTMRPATVFVELPVCLLISQTLFVACVLGLLPAFCLYFSHLILLFEIENAAFEVEGSRTARFHLRRYRVSSETLIGMKTQRNYYAAGLLGVVQAAVILIFSENPLEVIMINVAFLGLTLLVMRTVAWIFVWCMKRRIRLNSIIELCLFLLAAIVPLGLVIGLLLRSKAKGKELLDA